MKITQTKIKKWAIKAGIPFTSMGILILAYLQFAGVIEVHSYTHDIPCMGTLSNPCEAYINFTAKEDINVSGTTNPFAFSSEVKQSDTYLLVNGEWKKIDFKKSLKLYKNTNYLLKLVVLKNHPADNVVWSMTVGGDRVE